MTKNVGVLLTIFELLIDGLVFKKLDFYNRLLYGIKVTTEIISQCATTRILFSRATIQP